MLSQKKINKMYIFLLEDTIFYQMNEVTNLMHIRIKDLGSIFKIRWIY
jgi:hypothetical protein